MFYTKVATEIPGYKVKVPLEEGIFTECYKCNTEIEVNEEKLEGILEYGDLATTKILCNDCSIKSFRGALKEISKF